MKYPVFCSERIRQQVLGKILGVSFGRHYKSMSHIPDGKIMQYWRTPSIT